MNFDVIPSLIKRTRLGKPGVVPQSEDSTGRRTRLSNCSIFPALSRGMEEYAWHLAMALTATGHWSVSVLTTNGRRLRTTVTDQDGLHVVRIGSWCTYSYTPFSPIWPWQMRRWINRLDPEVVNAHTPVPLFADVAAWASGSRPFFLTHHAASLKKDAGRVFSLAERAYAIIERFTLGQADAVLAVSDFVKESLRERVKGTLVTVGNAVPVSSLSKLPPQSVIGQFVFIACLGKQHGWKGLDLILEACALCPDARLKVAGDGDRRAFYESRARELGISDRVEFLGTVRGQDKEDLIRGSSGLIVYPTTSNDAFPTVLLEAWAASIPVIVADIGALTTLVRDGIDGFLVPPLKPEALAQTLSYVIKNPAIAACCGKNGRNYVEHLTWDALAARFEQLVDSIQSERAGS